MPLQPRIEGLINSFGDSGCAAISILVGQNYGAHNIKRTKETLFKGLKLMISLVIVLSIIIVLLTKPMTLLFVEKSQYQVIHETFIYMFVVCIFYVFCFIGNVFVGFYRGIGHVDVPFKGTTMHVTLLRVILSSYSSSWFSGCCFRLWCWLDFCKSLPSLSI